MPRRPRSRFGGEPDKILTHFLEDREGKMHPFFESCIEHYRDTYLRSYNVSGDGHCLFYAVIRCIVSAYDRLSDETKTKAGLHIGDTAIQKFRDGAYLGKPRDVVKLRGEVDIRMGEYGDSSECIGASLSALEHSRYGRAMDLGLFADSACHYLSAMARILDICIALEYPFTSGRITTRKWRLFQPDKNPEKSLDQMREAGMEDASMLAEYNRILENGTQTSDVRCEQVIYLKLERGHYTSYLYDGEFETGKDTEEERLRLDADQKLAEQLKREDEEARRQLAQRESEVGSGPVFSDAEIAKQREAYEAFEAAKGAARQRFGAPHRRCSRAFVSHVLRAAGSQRFRY